MRLKKLKKKCFPYPRHEKIIAGMEVGLHIFFISAPVILTPGKNPTTHWLWGWGGLGAGLDVWDKKHLPLTGYKPRAVHPVAIPITPTRFLPSIRTVRVSLEVTHRPNSPVFRWNVACALATLTFLQGHVRPELREMCRSLHITLTPSSKNTPDLYVPTPSETYKIRIYTNHVEEITRQIWRSGDRASW